MTASLISLDFTFVAPEVGTSTTFSTAGDVWRASNISNDYNIDALFTITGTSAGNGGPALPTSTVAFVDEPARGNNMRVRVGGNPNNYVVDARVFITIQFVDAGTTNPFSGWSTGDQLITQFSDIDSDFGQDRTDFGGLASSTYQRASSSDNLDPGSSLLTLDSSTVPGYDIYRMQTPWGPQINVFDTDDVSQSPVTGAFLLNAASLTNSSFDLAVGQLSNGAEGDRHIDIDMTPDSVIVPEPSSTLLVGLTVTLGLGFRRRR